ncbi:MAG: glycerophosphodiester phosphodiesterase family protein [Actinomyces sp.]|uniref:glycerophosphodiester phosphodiesterase n=1 Tax=Actinomyces sp. TaxID=29317 RepID=UPI0026DC14D8|nr:glycerophosphodiester phosphodiesterase family protein [Actinomyces sp.]MDO4243819.1 glycerophosphodiester phosphodiesterase family protein [Actinomyces sp.]
MKANEGSFNALSAVSQAGDLALIVMCSQFGDTAARPPEGWTGQHTGSAGGRSGYIASRVVTDPSETQGVQWWSDNATDAARQRGALIILSGIVSHTLTAWAGAVPAVDGPTLLVSQQHATSATALTEWPADPVVIAGEASTAASWSSLRAGIVSAAPVGVTGPQAWAAVRLVAEEALPWAEVDGQRATVSVWDGAREVPVTRAGVMPSGAPTVDALLAAPRFVVAHRGGSQSWVEHTARAYTQAVAHGCPALEFSAARTLDGVWIGHHDRTMARLGGGDVDPATLTWEQVQAALPESARPVTLDWLLATYGGTHTVVFDPKYRAGDRLDEYLELLAPYRGRVLLKFAGDADWLFRLWRERGFRTWAYAYAASAGEAWYQAMLTNSDIDVLSMEWDAPAEVWQALTATGKPVVAHIPGSREQVETGWARGAAGAICSAPNTVLPLRV